MSESQRACYLKNERQSCAELCIVALYKCSLFHNKDEDKKVGLIFKNWTNFLTTLPRLWNLFDLIPCSEILRHRYSHLFSFSNFQHFWFSAKFLAVNYLQEKLRCITLGVTCNMYSYYRPTRLIHMLWNWNIYLFILLEKPIIGKTNRIRKIQVGLRKMENDGVMENKCTRVLHSWKVY